MLWLEKIVVIVSEIAGTTRDSIDTNFMWNDQEYVPIDTAGIRRKSKVTGDIERYSVIRAIAAIERSDVCLLMMDATEASLTRIRKLRDLPMSQAKGSLSSSTNGIW